MSASKCGLHSGLLGEKLGHSYSPQIHSLMADYEYKLFEKSREEVEDFIKNGEWQGINVTIPYKTVAASLCDELSETAKMLKSTNTLVRKDGKILGYNTDFFGFSSLVKKSGISVEGKKALVLGSGGTSVTATAVLKEMGAFVVVISRSGENNYENLDKNSDASIIVNTTPVGMYPKNGEAPLDLRLFCRLECVFDVIYNPTRTALMLQAESLGIPCFSGLHMLVAQAKRSCELFTDTELDDGIIDSIEKTLSVGQQNIILIGMPGCGKTEISKRLASSLGREVIDSDKEIVDRAGKSIPDIFRDDGEEAFRKLETKVLSDLGKLSGKIISTGGGCVTRCENYPLLHQNGIIVRLKRDINLLPKDGRPLSQRNDLAELARKREPMYASFADFVVDNNGTPEETVEAILKLLDK